MIGLYVDDAKVCPLIARKGLYYSLHARYIECSPVAYVAPGTFGNLRPLSLTLRFLNIVESVWGFYWGQKFGPYAFFRGYLDYRRSLYRFLRVHCIVDT